MVNKLLMNLAPRRGPTVSVSVTVWRGYLLTGHKCTWYEAYYFVTVSAVNGDGTFCRIRGKMLNMERRNFTFARSYIRFDNF